MTFNSFDFRPELLKSLAELGYETPTPIQSQTIPLLLEGHDVIGCAQTGTGKTAAFALPILQKLEAGTKGPQALIITPTRELAEQIDQNIKAYTRYLKITCQSVYGGVNIGPQETRLRKGVDIVVATPGRLLDHLQRKTLSLRTVKFLVLDEADRMLDMGFLPDIKRILKHVPDERQTLLFSATMPKEIEALVKSLTHEAKAVNISPQNTTADTVEQCVYPVEKSNKLRLLMHMLTNQSMYSVIVFSRTRHGADRIARQLGKQGISVARIHADRSQNQRQQALDGFKQGKFQVLVATDIAARGIDVENISHVINFDTPVHAEDYVHRIGRTGRAEATGDAFTFTSPEEDKYLKAIEKLIGRTLPVADRSKYEAAIQPSADAEAALSSKLIQKTGKAPSKTLKPAKESAKTQAQTQSEPRSGRGKSEARGFKSEARGLRSDSRSPKSEARGPRSEARGPKSEARSPRSERAPSSRSPRNEARDFVSEPPRMARSQQAAGPAKIQPNAQARASQRPQPRSEAAERSSRTESRYEARSDSRQSERPRQDSSRSTGQSTGQRQSSSRSAQPNRSQSASRGQQSPERHDSRQLGNAGKPASHQGRQHGDGYVSRTSGGSVRVVKRSQGSYPLSGEVDYIELDDDRKPAPRMNEDDDRQPQNIDVNTWGYPRNPVYEPWKNKGGQGGAGGPGSNQSRRPQQRRRP
jgi:ATP-dependent RNA helicase RhlE